MTITRRAGFLAFVLTVLAQPLWAQAQLPEMPSLPTSIDSQVFGSSAITDLGELLYFGRDTILTLVLTAIIVFHPVRRRSRHTLMDLQMPRLFFLYALIGLAVGFLVIRHGYVIGFVVFGIGTLMRFRSSLDDPLDTAEVILVTLIGLTVGLGLPVMAMLFTLVGWGKIWLGGLKRGFEITVSGKDTASTQAAETALKALVDEQGWQGISTMHFPSKNSYRVLLFAPGSMRPDAIQNTVTASMPQNTEARIRF